MANEQKKGSPDDAKRKKITIGLIVAIVVFLGWQVSSMMGGGGGEAPPLEPPKTDMAAGQPGGATPPGGGAAPTAQPQPQMARALPMSQREMELLRLQQDTQTKYVEAMNELQMLKLSLEIAETNKNIMAAKLATIKDQKDIVEILTPPKKQVATPDYGRTLTTPSMPAPVITSNMQAEPQPLSSQPQAEEPRPMAVDQMQPQQSQQEQQASMQPQQPEEVVQYTVVSVSKLQNRWSAVIGVQGSLYSVHIGDIIPVDGSKIKEINSRGIVLERKGREHKVSLIPII